MQDNGTAAQNQPVSLSILLKYLGGYQDERENGRNEKAWRPWRREKTWRPRRPPARSTADALKLVPAIRGELAAMTRECAPYDIAMMEDFLADDVAPRRFPMLLLGLFAASALVLAGVGVYGMISYSVAQRTREFGVRMALGAQEANVLRLVLNRGLKLTAVGLVLGLPIALALARVLSGQLYEIGTADPLTFSGVSALLAAVALLACYIPARRATKVDPAVALRYE